MQLIPGHSNIPGNDIDIYIYIYIGDTLAKTGSRQELPHTHTTYETVKQII